jgi:transcriptional regulator with XRE-family HTH domain
MTKRQPQEVEGDDLATLGGRMRVLMRRQRLSSEAVAAELGVSGSAVRKWTLNKGEPLLAHLRAFAALTDGSLVWLLEGPEGEGRVVADAVIRFADGVADGEDPAAVLAALTGGAGVAGLSQAAIAMRAVLDAHAPALWSELSHDAKRRVLLEVEAVAREKRRRRPSGRPSDEKEE